MQKLVTILVMTSLTTLVGCSSNDDSDPDSVNGIPGASTLNELVDRPANSLPINDGLDQVNADLLTLFGEADSTPILVDVDDTVASIITKQEVSR